MTQRLNRRMIAHPEGAFIACSNLSIKNEGLNAQNLREISGGNPFWVAVGIGVTIWAVTHPQEAVETADWYIDRVSEGIDFVAETVDSWASGIAEGMANLNY